MKRSLLSLVMLLGLILTPVGGAWAQPTRTDEAYTSEITGDEINLGSSGNISFIPENFDFNETFSFQEEFIWFTYGWSNFQLVLIGGPNTSQNYHEITLGNMYDFYDSFELIGEEVTTEHSWFLGAAEFDGAPLIVYYEFELDAFGEIDLVLMQFTDPATFAPDLEFVQNEVTIGGAPLLPNTDAEGLSGLLGNASGTSQSSSEGDEEESTSGRTSRTSRSSTDTTGEGDEADEEESTTSRTSRTSRTGTNTTDGDDEGNTSERTNRSNRGGTITTGEDDSEVESTPEGSSRTSRSTKSDTTEDTDRSTRAGRLGDRDSRGDTEIADDSTPVAGGDWDSMGLVSDSEWQSPQHDTVVTWDASLWQFPSDFDQAIVVNEDSGFDVLTLQTSDGFGYAYITVDLVYESTPRSLVEYWSSDEYQSQIASEITLLDSATTADTASIVYETTNLIDQPLVVVLEATFMGDGTIIFSQISAAPDTIELVYAQYTNGVEIDGAPLDLTWTVEDIRDIVTP